MLGRMIKIKGLNKRLLAIDRHNVMFLEEHNLDDVLATNIHFTNGRWATAGMPLDEVEALIFSASIEKEMDDHEGKKELERWKKRAAERIKIQREINESMKNAEIPENMKHKSFKKEMFPDGSGKLTIFFEPIEK